MSQSRRFPQVDLMALLEMPKSVSNALRMQVIAPTLRVVERF